MTQQVFASVWDALEDDSIERANMKLRSALMREIRDWYEASGMTQTEAARVLHISRPKLSSLLNGHIHLFTIDPCCCRRLATSSSFSRAACQSLNTSRFSPPRAESNPPQVQCRQIMPNRSRLSHTR